MVLEDVDGHDHIGGGRAFNHSALYWHKREPVIPESGELGLEGSALDYGGESAQVILDKTDDGTKNLDENVQEITSNMKDYSICVRNFEKILIKRYQKGPTVCSRGQDEFFHLTESSTRVIMYDFRTIPIKIWV